MNPSSLVLERSDRQRPPSILRDYPHPVPNGDLKRISHFSRDGVHAKDGNELLLQPGKSRFSISDVLCAKSENESRNSQQDLLDGTWR